MPEGIEPTVTDPQPTSDPQPASEPAEQRVPLAELLKERKARQELDAKLKQFEQSQLSEAEKLQARVKELEAFEPEVAMFRQRAERQRDDLLKALPKERRERLQSTLETLTLAQQLEILEVTVPEAAAAREANVPRGSPAPAKRALTLDQINNDRSLLDSLSKEELAELAGQAGIKTTTGKVWG